MSTPNDPLPLSQTAPPHEPGVPNPPGREAVPEAEPAGAGAGPAAGTPSPLDPADPLLSEPLGDTVPNDPIGDIVPRRGGGEPVHDLAHTPEQRPVEPEEQSQVVPPLAEDA